MRILVVGAGASRDEGLRLGLSEEDCPPLMTNFCSYLWGKEGSFNAYFLGVHYVNEHSVSISMPILQSPESLQAFNDSPLIRTPYLMDEFLREKGYEFTDPLSLFMQLEQDKSVNHDINVENYFAYIWNLQSDYLSLRRRLMQREEYNQHLLPKTWRELWYYLIKQGIGQAFVSKIQQHFLNTNNGEIYPLKASQTVASVLKPGDVVVNLNYDTLFEIGLEQSNKISTYASQNTKRSFKYILVAKPHGSLNALHQINGDWHTITYTQPNIYGMVPPPHLDVYTTLFPPKSEKHYKEQPYSNSVIKIIQNLKPNVLTFWGVGFTASDYDLFQLYSHWAGAADRIEIINPSESIEKEIAENSDLTIEPSKVTRFWPLEEWVESVKRQRY